MQTTIQMRRPHSDKQRAMIVYPGNVVAFAGRRFGKTDAFVQRIFYHMQRQPGLYWWVGLSWRSASMKRAFRIVSYYARRILQSMGIADRGYINRSTSEIRIPHLGEIWFRTADNPASMAGEGIYGAVLDEFSLMPEIVWTEYVQATLLDYGGWAAFGGVPKGYNWAARLWESAAERDGWCQIHATSYDNPFMSRTRLDTIRTETTDSLFRQEYLADILAEKEASIFQREWWAEKGRFSADGRELRGQVVARYQSWDTAEETGDDNAWTVCVTVEVLKDYRMAVRHVYRARMTFDALPGAIESMARQWSHDGLLRGVVIEDKSSGKSAIYTLKASAADWLRPLIQPFRPQGSKEARASAASVWCRNGMVLLPQPGEGAEWLLTLEDELFSFPQSAFADQVDALGQGITYLENYLAEGYRARRGRA